MDVNSFPMILLEERGREICKRKRDNRQKKKTRNVTAEDYN